MKTRLRLLSLFIFGAAISLNAQETPEEFTPSGKMLFELHAHANAIFSGTDSTDTELSETAMEATRAYLGYAYKLKPEWTTTILLDFNASDVNADGFKVDRFVFLKTASLTYKKDGLSLDMGLIGLYQHKVQESHWGHRYVYKSAQDEYKMSHSADVGVLAQYAINDMIMIDAVVRNGEGFKQIQADKKYVVGGGLTITPIEGITVRAFGDVLADTAASQSTIATFVGYKKKDFGSFGAEYNIRSNNKNVKDANYSVMSLYGTVNATEKMGVFARYDSEMAEGVDAEGFLIVGLEYIPFKNINSSLNVRSNFDKTTMVFLNLRVKI